MRNIGAIIGCMLVFGANSAAASHIPTLTFGGSIDTQAGYRDMLINCNLITDASGVICGNNQQYHDFAIVNDTKISLDFDGQTDMGIMYGAHVTINADTTNDKTNHSNNNSPYKDKIGYYTYTYVEVPELGRVELGNNTGAVDALKINAGTVSRATGGVSGDWRWWLNPKLSDINARDGLVLLTPDLPTNADTGGEDRAAKVTYYTPRVFGFSLGLSYIPDTEQHGTASVVHTVKAGQHTNTVDAFRNGGHKQVFSGGLNYHYNSGDFKMGIAAIGETGLTKNASFDSTIKREQLGAYEVGGKIGYKGVTLVGSYGNWHKSGQPKKVTSVLTGKQDASFWTAGVDLECGDLGINVGYFDSKKGNGNQTNGNIKRSNVSNVVLGVDYNLAAGMLPYFEASYFKLNEKAASTNGRNHGTILIAGFKVHF